ncbi:MAG TPA: hydantoinase B/oxoprolinase family protein [Planctomycetes bacterium]|nr:hydantoinase B/oxoprolinase family protein [Planctomycetota bacterium]HIN81222.1 hydantoinase B/oxoprolinase family protein [Planctomycetota bacterium]
MSAPPDPVQLRVFENLLSAIADEMGTALERMGFSPNIKERLDHSCAVFDGVGEMVAQAEHMPVHLGAMPMSVRAALDAHRFGRGDVILLNDPWQGGTHLPDLTMVSGYFDGDDDTPLFYLANRAHHADVGGVIPGSMGLFRTIDEEGVLIPPTLVIEGGVEIPGVLEGFFSKMRNPGERRGDLDAQLGALRVGEMGLERLLERIGRNDLLEGCGALQDAAERHVERLIASIPDGRWHGEEFLDDDGFQTGPIPLRVAVTVSALAAHFDFTGSAPATEGPMNCNPAVVTSAVFYVLRTLAGEEIPSNSGCLRPVEITIPTDSILDPPRGSAVAAGNVETSQRLVDLLFTALAPALPDRVPAQSQGTMNNLVLGNDEIAYYETIGGGGGASPRSDGISGRHSHMSNTRNTPVEQLEHALAVRVIEYSLRRGSGGSGTHVGGDGIVREIELLESFEAAILSERRQSAPAGLAGGLAGEPGRNTLTHEGQRRELPGKWQGILAAGDRLRIETPGGGGWGNPETTAE